MDDMRMRKLAGIDTTMLDQLNESIQELDLLEKVYQGRNIGPIDTDEMSIEEVQKRMDAGARAFKLVHQLRDPIMRKKHISRIMSNTNTISAALNYMMKNQEEEDVPSPAEAGL